MIEIRRDEDQELCGWVVADGADAWRALTVFGADLARCPSAAEASRVVLDQGLASLAAHWLLTGPGFDGEQIVCIQSASPGSVTVALDYYSFPGVPTLTLSAADLGTGPWRLRRSDA